MKFDDQIFNQVKLSFSILFGLLKYQNKGLDFSLEQILLLELLEHLFLGLV